VTDKRRLFDTVDVEGEHLRGFGSGRSRGVSV